MFSFYLYEEEYLDYFTNQKRRENLKKMFSVPAEAYKNEDDKAILKCLFKEINTLEIALLEKPFKIEKRNDKGIIFETRKK